MAFLQWLLTVILAAIGKTVVDVAEEDKATERTAEGAVAKAEATTQGDIAETADAQAHVNAADRGGARNVAARLRERLAHRAGPDGQ